MKSLPKTKRRNFISKSVAAALGVSIIPAIALKGCRESTKNGETVLDTHPENWGLVTFFELDPKWPQKPEEYSWGAVSGATIDKNDNVWMINRAIPIVQVYNSDGEFIKAWGESGSSADSITDDKGYLTFPRPGAVHQIKIDHEGNIWLAMWHHYVVYKCAPDGKLLMTLGSFNERGPEANGTFNEREATHFYMPQDMAIAPSGEIFVADGDHDGRIVHFDPQGKFIKSWGKRGVKPGEFSCPHSIAIDSKGLIYVAERGNSRIQIFDQNGKFLDQWPDIIVPFDLKITDNDDIWVCGYGTLRIPSSSPLPLTEDQMVIKFNSEGKVMLIWNLPRGHNQGEFDELHGIAVDSKGNLYFADARANRIQKYVLQNRVI